MHMWYYVLFAAVVLLIASAVYLTSCFHRLSALKRLGEKHPALSWLIAALPAAASGAIASVSITSAVIVLLHLAAGFLLCGLLALIVRKALHRELSMERRAVIAVLLTTAYLGAGWFFAHHVFETDYAVSTGKDVGAGLRIAVVSDAHLGVTLDGEKFARQMERINALEPDAVAIVGDFVDGSSRRDDMLTACRALGTLKTTYGVYFVYGNHDDDYSSREFSPAALRAALTENGVTILEDSVVPLGDSAYLIGRCDRQTWGRMDAQRLTEGLDPSKYMIMLDHQPNDYEREAAAGVDLVLSGHTHGGHIFPAGPIGLLMGANDRVYGREERGTTTFIVSSGISGWGIPFKTGTISEFVVINVTGRK